ncbi:MAG: EAL domain-containing protein [Dokdonella sp.]
MVPFGLLAGCLLSGLLHVIRVQVTQCPAAIRAALGNREFFVQVQPIVRLSDRDWVDAKVLMRWCRQDGQMARPNLFDAVAEDAPIIKRIAARVLKLAEQPLHAFARHS